MLLYCRFRHDIISTFVGSSENKSTTMIIILSQIIWDLILLHFASNHMKICEKCQFFGGDFS
jgi:chromosome condensin MukBEF ATPase and DNA-binding subunit MukB